MVMMMLMIMMMMMMMMNCVCGVIYRLALFPVGTIVRDPNDGKSPTRSLSLGFVELSCSVVVTDNVSNTIL